ncbi:hypothetical protein KY337_01285 [Candidatus Woesearchaeota archaeon]|nr:hypothetical protein [Candidatus Woesearchaeota archaeon]
MKGRKQEKVVEEKSSSNFISFGKLLDTISEGNPERLLNIVVEHLKINHSMSRDEILTKISMSRDSILVPINIFAAKLSPAEALVKYLKEEFEMGYHEIASLINRDERGVWGSYRRACTKMKEKFKIKEARFFIPISFFKERKYSILENVVRYLVDNYELTTYKIAKVLNKKPSTLWSVYNRVKKKG